jgi:signal transduction histidine kinase
MELRWTNLRRPLREVRRHLGLIDVFVAALLTAGGLASLAHLHYRGPVVLAIVSCVSCTASVAIRRVWPQVALSVAVTSLAVYQSDSQDPQGAFVVAAVVLVSYMFGRSLLLTHRRMQGAFVLGYALAILEVVPLLARQVPSAGIAGTWLTAVVVPTCAGVLIEKRSQLADDLSVAVDRLHEEERIRLERAAAEERNRVARELHDVVAHHLSVMVIQASAARTVANQPESANAALVTVAESGRAALTDLRRITGVLRRNDAQWTDHLPRLDQLEMLLGRIRTAGVTARLRIVGDLGAVPPEIELAAYRIIQEALTNVVKHASTSNASVEVSISEDWFALSVTNDGADPSALRPRLPTSGQGLVGMRERVDLYRGQFTSGPTPSGGYEVRATIPLGDAFPARSTSTNTPIGKDHSNGRRRLAVRRHMDVLLAAAWLIALTAEAVTSENRHGSLVLNVVVVATMAVMGVWRRRWPLLFLVGVSGMAVFLDGGLDTLGAATLTGTYILAVPVFTVAVWARGPRAIAGLFLWEVGMVAIGLSSHAPVGGIAGAGVMACIVWAAGRAWRSYRNLHKELSNTISRLEDEGSQTRQLAIANQRGVIAQDLDRLVARDVVAMIVQAQATQSSCSPESIHQAAGTIEKSGRQALARMRDILGVLRAHDTRSGLFPPSITGAHSLHARVVAPYGLATTEESR